jgi:hypothetical protein
MVLRVTKQVTNEKMEVYYECILKLVNCLNHKANNNLPTTLFWLKLIAIVGMKWDTLFLYKEVAVICEENMGDVNEY